MIHAISYILQVCFMEQFFDMVNRYAELTTKLGDVLISLLLMGAAYAFAQFMNGLTNCYGQISNISFSKGIHNLLYRKLNHLNIISFEDNNQLDKINKAIQGSQMLFWVCTSILDLIFFYGIYFIILGWYLFSLKPILGISIIIIFVPSFLAKVVNVSIFQKLEDKAAPIRRKYEYFEKCMTDKEYLKETRILGINQYFANLYMKMLKQLNHYTFIASFKKNTIELLMKTVTVTGYGLIIFMLFNLVMTRSVSVGAFAAILASMRSMFNFMNEAISERFTWASDHIATVNNFIRFINEDEEVIRKISYNKNFNIKLKDVSFSYPGMSSKALNHINVSLEKGQTIAIVGENGSGKSTFCRLLAGLYNPSEGTVFYDNMSSKNVALDNISAVFQNFCKYKFTIRENICISKNDKKIPDSQLTDLCERTGVKIEYTNGLDTMLSCEFDGIDISGGQWQRIAIARGIYREHNLIILDEPTSAIDPIEETRLYQEFLKLCKGKSAIIVTHRLASVKIADRIIVLKNGEIVQDGNHNQLINIDGEYKNMYNEQKKWYVSN